MLHYKLCLCWARVHDVPLSILLTVLSVQISADSGFPLTVYRRQASRTQRRSGRISCFRCVCMHVAYVCTPTRVDYVAARHELVYVWKTLVYISFHQHPGMTSFSTWMHHILGVWCGRQLMHIKWCDIMQLVLVEANTSLTRTGNYHASLPEWCKIKNTTCVSTVKLSVRHWRTTSLIVQHSDQLIWVKSTALVWLPSLRILF